MKFSPVLFTCNVYLRNNHLLVIYAYIRKFSAPRLEYFSVFLDSGIFTTVKIKFNPILFDRIII